MSWYFDKEELLDTPSFRDGMDLKTESGLRVEGVYFIRNMGKKINLGYNTIATAIVYFHRFYMCHSFQDYPLYITACSCLFLAGKAEETPKRSKDLLKAAWEILSNDELIIMQKFGETPRENIMRFESVLLQTINFEFDIEHPYKYLLKYGKYLKGDKTKLQTIVQMAWNFLNDSLRTTLCLEWEPEVIAIALIHVSSKLCSFKIVDWKGRKPKHTKWWDLFIEDLDYFILEDIGNQILDLYPEKKTAAVGSSPSSIATPDAQTSSSSSSPDESISLNLDDSNLLMPKFKSLSSNFYLPGFPPVDLSVPPPKMFSAPPPVNFTIPPPVNLAVPPPINLPVPPPVNLPVPPPLNLPVAPPVNLPIPSPVKLPRMSSVNLPSASPVKLPRPPSVNSPVPPPANFQFPVNMCVPPPVNFSVPPPNFSASEPCNISPPSLLPAVNEKINYSCVSTPDLAFNKQLSYSTRT